MRDILPELERWTAANEPIALATVIHTWGSAPRGVGGKMAFTPDGKITGSVSGGCVEGAVIQAGAEVLASGLPQLLHFGVADEMAWDVGLACGGQIDVFVQPFDRTIFQPLRAALAAGQRFSAASVVRGPDELLGREVIVSAAGRLATSLPPGRETAIENAARQALAAGGSQSVDLPQDVEVFVEVVEPQPTLVVVGGAHTSIALTRLAADIGYHTVVVDPRRAFGSAARFPHIDQLIQAWPDEAFHELTLTEDTAIVMLTHDPKIDDPALQIALQSPAYYVGVLGSGSNQVKIRTRLREAGLAEEQIARLHGPIGLKLNGATPEEIALTVLTEIVTERHKAPAVESSRRAIA
ncbi:MAG TPA: XdhC/CoxI family protein [Anaerolineaceae bacterium]